MNAENVYENEIKDETAYLLSLQGIMKMEGMTKRKIMSRGRQWLETHGQIMHDWERTVSKAGSKKQQVASHTK